MELQPLGDSGIEVSRVGLGCNNFGGRIDKEQARAVVDAALEAGVTFFDTAHSYGDGRSEEFLGELLEGRRDRVVLATKFGAMRESAGDLRKGSREYLRRSLGESLRRLRTDRVDVFYVHFPDPETPLAETLGAMQELVDEGVVRAIGCSNFSAAQLREADGLARDSGKPGFAALQNRYNLLEREVEQEVLPLCRELGVGFVPYFPLASGLLTGKYTRGQEATEGRLAGREIPEERWDRAEQVQRYADERGVPILHVAIGGLLAMPAIASVIAGATKPEQLRATVEDGAWEPSADDVEALRALG
jgi:aryl-alcohol dehydrogenase-like predicted oxidoreductase